MIRVGWLPSMSRPSRRRTLPYTRKRRIELKPGCANTLHVQNTTPEPAPHVEPRDFN